MLENSSYEPEGCCKTVLSERNWNPSLIEEDAEEELVELLKGPDNSLQVQYPLQPTLHLPDVPQDDQAS